LAKQVIVVKQTYRVQLFTCLLMSFVLSVRNTRFPRLSTRRACGLAVLTSLSSRRRRLPVCRPSPPEDNLLPIIASFRQQTLTAHDRSDVFIRLISPLSNALACKPLMLQIEGQSHTLESRRDSKLQLIYVYMYTLICFVTHRKTASATCAGRYLPARLSRDGN